MTSARQWLLMVNFYFQCCNYNRCYNCKHQSRSALILAALACPCFNSIREINFLVQKKFIANLSTKSEKVIFLTDFSFWYFGGNGGGRKFIFLGRIRTRSLSFERRQRTGERPRSWRRSSLAGRRAQRWRRRRRFSSARAFLPSRQMRRSF